MVTEEQKEIIIKLYGEKKTFEEIGKVLNHSRYWVGKEVNKLLGAGELDKRPVLHTITEALKPQYQRVMALYNDGLTYENIGKEVGVSESRIKVIVQKLREMGYVGEHRTVKRKTRDIKPHIAKVQRTDTVWNEQGIKCTCKVSNTCVFGFTFECDKPLAQKCNYLGAMHKSRPKAEDGLCHVYQKITKDNPRRVEKEFNAYEGTDVIW